jgi:hypothetical protein
MHSYIAEEMELFAFQSFVDSRLALLQGCRERVLLRLQDLAEEKESELREERWQRRVR